MATAEMSSTDTVRIVSFKFGESYSSIKTEAASEVSEVSV